MNKETFIKYSHLSLLGFLGLSAIIGGGALILSPSGKLLGGLPMQILNNSPFNDFFYPGIILFTILGMLPVLIAWSLIRQPFVPIAEHLNIFKDMYWAWTFSTYIPFALIIWIQVETVIIQGTGWLQTFYILYAIPMLIVALLPQTRYRYSKKHINYQH